MRSLEHLKLERVRLHRFHIELVKYGREHIIHSRYLIK